MVTGIGYMLLSGNLTVVVDRHGNGWAALFDQKAEMADLVKVHPGFRDASSAVLHRFAVDPGYNACARHLAGAMPHGCSLQAAQRWPPQ